MWALFDFFNGDGEYTSLINVVSKNFIPLQNTKYNKERRTSKSPLGHKVGNKECLSKRYKIALPRLLARMKIV